MSTFLNLTPTVRVSLRNPFAEALYPRDGSVVAVIDTGYEGFVAIPGEVFRLLKLDIFEQETRTLILANGRKLASEGAYATLELPHIAIKLSGFMETYDGIEEIILGVEALSRFTATFDYCSKRINLQPCQQHSYERSAQRHF